MSQFTSSQNAPIPLTSKGDLVTHDGTTTVRLPVGTNSYFLKADSTSATGLTWAVVTGGSGEDHHASWYDIISLQTVTIEVRKQSVVFGEFILDGTLLVDGQFILEV